MRRLAAAVSIAALFFFAVPVRARTEAVDAQASSDGGSSTGKSGCMVAAPGVPATLTGLGLMVAALALGYRRRR